ncbi:hypothetical protein [Streptomyces sp. NBC_00198]|uniref:hypothetical protein n=1 Tax=Streptomyces sp. NBC_00198 TaxID=2975677 RepID=UPI00225BDF22|nr:hypothetical protein [Streptomyces sp. NBC_00198]MCX5285974.1 hypothetical protein [Streptomyces sp. NBC_00198]MCX5286283.1 hypothetical protein [Streptomyces sp. NBC_00198]
MNRTAISDLARALRALGEHGDELNQATATPDALAQLRSDLVRVRGLLEAVAEPAPSTTCAEHPRGPVEPGTDGDCLLCSVRRARATRAESEDVPRDAVVGVIQQLGHEAAVRMYGGRAVAAAAAGGRRTRYLNPGVQPEAADV